MSRSKGFSYVAGVAVLWLVSLLLALFFGFVGWMKASAPVSMLAQHGAWTTHIPEPVGRLVGVSEIACALLLICGLLPRRHRLGAVAAGVLIVNQCIAAAVHAARGETGALPQNAVLIALCIVVLLLHRSRARIT